MRGPATVVLVGGLGLLLLLGGCIAWNETGITRAERQVHRLVRPGMTAAEAEAALREAGIGTWRPEEEKGEEAGPETPAADSEVRIAGTLSSVQNLYIGTADLQFLVWIDAKGRVLRVTTRATSCCL
jgi:hypothetical protein